MLGLGIRQSYRPKSITLGNTEITNLVFTDKAVIFAESLGDSGSYFRGTA